MKLGNLHIIYNDLLLTNLKQEIVRTHIYDISSIYGDFPLKNKHYHKIPHSTQKRIKNVGINKPPPKPIQTHIQQPANSKARDLERKNGRARR